ncbi:hypothetical protein BBF96_11540 [Anoxybacter fermentans]|uniref:Uncharacterized protein n=1 Tax=Anoxybacter fermentans TaxID=1323375 RepID=A0A3S9T088_9FIRM|nr:S8 family serine peptidase [Anoxybacter fermentans]AZR73968.1 hypothetical protein BBF96_11540 [Anoxybacter fermentans]
MNNKLVVISLILLILFLTGCHHSNITYIDGKVVDQNYQPIEGIRVKYEGSVVETNSWGRFGFSLFVDQPEFIEITFDGTHLGFGKMTRTVQVCPNTNYSMGTIKMERNLALVYGTVTYPHPDTIYANTLNTERIELPAIDGPAYVDGEIIVKFKDIIQTQSVKTLSTEIGIEILSKSSNGQFINIKTSDDIIETIQALEKRPDVEYAEPNYYLYPLSNSKINSLSYERDYDQQWNLQAINIENALKEVPNSSDIIVAVLDTGIKKGVPDLDSNILWDLGYDFVEDDNDPGVFWNSHGTRVAYIINSVTGNSVSILPIRILRSATNDTAWGTTWELIEGLEYAIQIADVINLSVAIKTPYGDIQSVSDIIKEAEEAGVLIIAAAGNDGYSSPAYPASDSRVLSVGAVGPSLQPASYTNRGVDIYAPGGDYNLYPIGKENTIWVGDGWAEGTSLASAHVAGVAAMILAKEDLTPSELRSRLRNTSLKLAYDDGAGLVDAYRAVTGIEHGRIFVFVGKKDYWWDEISYNTEESTYTYAKEINGYWENYFEITTVEPGDRWIYAWIDRDANKTLNNGDYFAEKWIPDLKPGEARRVDLVLEYYYD